ncbi:MAG TPA: hypothetical protein PL080_00680 [Candidatus Syntrophosphaera thermopropionivorans]|nr:hypothetical protein [Candidatus Syntrophosphaera thermopropionivorans]
MKKNSGIYIGCGVIVLILVVAFLAGYFIGFAPQGKNVAQGSWLVLDLSGQVTDYSILQSSNFLGYNPLSVTDICYRIRKAADDNKIKGILIKPNLLQTDYANLNEINAALQDFKKSHKPVIAYGEVLAQKIIFFVRWQIKSLWTLLLLLESCWKVLPVMFSFIKMRLRNLA